MSKVVFFSDSPGRELPRTRKVYLLNKDVEHLLTPSRSSFEEGEKGSGVVLPTENLLEAVETFVQKTLVQIVVKNLELVAHNKSPDLSTSSSWSSALIQRAKLKYLKTSKLADFFSSEKQQSSDTGESQK